MVVFNRSFSRSPSSLGGGGRGWIISNSRYLFPLEFFHTRRDGKIIGPAPVLLCLSVLVYFALVGVFLYAFALNFTREEIVREVSLMALPPVSELQRDDTVCEPLGFIEKITALDPPYSFRKVAAVGQIDLRDCVLLAPDDDKHRLTDVMYQLLKASPAEVRKSISVDKIFLEFEDTMAITLSVRIGTLAFSDNSSSRVWKRAVFDRQSGVLGPFVDLVPSDSEVVSLSSAAAVIITSLNLDTKGIWLDFDPSQVAFMGSGAIWPSDAGSDCPSCLAYLSGFSPFADVCNGIARLESPFSCVRTSRKYPTVLESLSVAYSSFAMVATFLFPGVALALRRFNGHCLQKEDDDKDKDKDKDGGGGEIELSNAVDTFKVVNPAYATSKRDLKSDGNLARSDANIV